MKIELKNIKYAAFQSQETHCFEATVYVDGVKSFGVSNDGHGGCDNFFPVKGGVDHPHHRVAEIDEDLNREELPTEWDPKITINNSLEIVIGDLVNDWLAAKEVKKILKRISYLKPNAAGKVGLYQLPAKFKPTDQRMAEVKNCPWWQDDYVMLPELGVEKATEAMKAAGVL